MRAAEDSTRPLPVWATTLKTPEAGPLSGRGAGAWGKPHNPCYSRAPQAPRPKPQEADGLQLASSWARDGVSLMRRPGAGIRFRQLRDQLQIKSRLVLWRRPWRHDDGTRHDHRATYRLRPRQLYAEAGPKIAASRMPRGHHRQLVLLQEQPLDRVRRSGAFDAECAFGAAERRTDREVHRHAVLRCDCPPGNRFGQRRSRKRAYTLS
jgi:hypothetical protein